MRKKKWTQVAIGSVEREERQREEGERGERREEREREKQGNMDRKRKTNK